MGISPDTAVGSDPAAASPTAPSPNPPEPIGTGPPAGPRGRLPLSLGLLTTGFAALYFALSVLRYESFYTTNWDLGINMQMLWTNTHGYLLFETGDASTTGANSFLLIHSTYVALPISYLYWAAPYAATLFALQAAAIAASAVPLYWIGRDEGLPEPLLLGALVAYLISFPVISGVLYDFHWESFLPLEFVAVYYLWGRRRYALALVPATLGILTLEIFPFLMLGLVLYFAYPHVREFLTRPASLRGGRPGEPGAGPLLGLTLFALVAYAVVRLVEYNVIPVLAGTSTASSSAQLGMAVGGYSVIGTDASHLGPSLLYWFLLLAAFGFVPVIARRRLLLASLPWFLYSVVVAPHFSGFFGDQYSLIAIPPLALGFVEGLGVMHRGACDPSPPRPTFGEWPLLVAPFLVAGLFFSVPLLTARLEGGIVAAALAASVMALVPARRLLRRRRTAPRSARIGRFRLARRSPRERQVALALVAVLLLVGGEVAMSPLDPTNYQATVLPGYHFSWSTNPEFPFVAEMTAHIPANAPLLASDNLFPYVANNPHAYALLWYPATPPYLPFNASHLPPYVFLSSSEWYAVPPFLGSVLFSPSVYGVVVTVNSSSTYPGSLYLFEQGYTGSTVVLSLTPSRSALPTDANA